MKESLLSVNFSPEIERYRINSKDNGKVESKNKEYRNIKIIVGMVKVIKICL